jgi:hypothetical protein
MTTLDLRSGYWTLVLNWGKPSASDGEKGRLCQKKINSMVHLTKQLSVLSSISNSAVCNQCSSLSLVHHT